jgi:hypothetical protein
MSVSCNKTPINHRSSSRTGSDAPRPSTGTTALLLKLGSLQSRQPRQLDSDDDDIYEKQHSLHSTHNHPTCFSAVPAQRSSSAPSSAPPPTAASPSPRDNVCQPNALFRDLPTSEEGNEIS